MTIQTRGFTFDNKTSDEYGLMVCEFDGNTPSDTTGGNIEFTLTSSPIQNRWYKSGNANYSEAIKFEFQVMKQNFEPIDSYEYSAIARWLQRKDDYKEFTVTRLDYDTVHFNAQLNVSPISVAGNIFAAPGPQACVEAIKMADKGHGVLFVVLNHAGDMLTGNLTMKQVKKLGINVVKVVTQEDVANATRENADDRRGLVGCVPLYKIAGAAAAAGKSLEEVAAIAQKFADNMATIAVATKGATHPATGMEIAHIAEGTMEVGMGQHGEGGGGTQPMKSADETAAIMMDALLKDLDVKAGEKLMVVINGSGATTLMEQLIVFRACHKLLAEKGIEVVASAVGEILTVQETAGFQMFIARMDDELLGYWNAPCRTPYYRN